MHGWKQRSAVWPAQCWLVQLVSELPSSVLNASPSLEASEVQGCVQLTKPTGPFPRAVPQDVGAYRGARVSRGTRLARKT